MIDLCDRYYTRASASRYPLVRKLSRYLVRRVFNFLFPIYVAFSKCKTSSSHKGLIVSLTSFPQRLHKLHLVLESIFAQSHPPKAIYLWLSREQIASINDIPKKLRDMQKRGLHIRFVEGNCKSHKKYVYALRKFPNETIVLIDDDIIYRTRMLEDLERFHELYPGSIVAQYAREIERSSSGICPYSTWDKILTTQNVNLGDIFFGSGGGTLIPPHALADECTSIELALRLCPHADDIWLNAMARLKGTPICKTDYSSANLELIYPRNITLSSINNGEDQNDVQLKNVETYYKGRLVW